MALIIVIEDNEAIRENTLELLELEGFTAIGAAHGEEGIQMINEHRPDLVISDVHMPGKNGYDVLDALKSSPLLSHTPFIFLTSDSEKKDVDAGLHRGASGYLTKPFEPEELFNTVRKFCQTLQ